MRRSRFGHQTNVAMATLWLYLFLLILPMPSSAYQRRRKPESAVCPKAFHLIGEIILGGEKISADMFRRKVLLLCRF